MSIAAPQVPTARGFAAEWPGQRVVFGDGALGRLPAETDLLGVQRVLLIASARRPAAGRAAALLGGRLAGHWDDVRQHVPGDLASDVAARARQLRADAVIAVGGGSAIGVAKICALELQLPVLAVPTTYAGSEMTPVWGRTDGGAKRTGRHQAVLPRAVIYDPELVAGLPAAQAGPSAMNALAHCVEALYAPAADPLTSLTALEGARLIASALPAAYPPRASGPASRADQMSGIEPVRALLWASCLAGRAFGAAGGSLHHALCHLLGGAGLPHAETHAAVLPHVVAYLAPALERELTPLAGALRAEPADVAGAIWDLAAASGAPPGLRALGLTERDLPAIASALAGRDPAAPRKISAADALDLLTAAWRGDRPDAARSVAPREPEPMTASALTESVVTALRPTRDPRLRLLLTSLIRSLHGYVADVSLTREEWLAAIEFLTATGQLCSDRRQEFILLSDTLGVSMLVDLLAGPAGEGTAGFATESTVLGPFYVPGSPERAYGASIAERPSGEPAWISGLVTDIDGGPIAGATLDVWQNADDMLYAVQNPAAPSGNLRGRFRTRSDGSFAFLGVRPTDYPIPDDGPVGRLLAATGRHPWRPAHIHMIVSAPGFQTVATHIFDSASRYLDSDAVFAVKASLIREFERHEPAGGGTDGSRSAQVPDGVPPGTAWYSLRHDFRLAPETG